MRIFTDLDGGGGWGFIEVQRPLISSLQHRGKQMEPALGIFQVSALKEELRDCF